ncbi:MAG: COG1361 S-layer family protein [Candidatus Methanofastidiosia archaeon]
MKLYSVALLGLLLFFSIETTEPTMSIDYTGHVAPGDFVVFSIFVDNTTVNSCNNGVVYIDVDSINEDIKKYVSIIKGEEMLEPLLQSGEGANLLLQLEMTPDTPNGEYDIPIMFEGTLGTCDGGCFPFSAVQTCTITVERKVPELRTDFERTFDVVGGNNALLHFSFTNTGTGNAKDLKISISGSIEGTVTPDTFLSIATGSTNTATISLNTELLEPGIYYLNVNVLYYDSYFKLYTEKIPFMVQVRPYRPQLEIEILNSNRSIIVEIKNEGGIKASEITFTLYVNDEAYLHETIDEIKTRGSILIPVQLDDGIYGGTLFFANAEYGGCNECYSASKEIFINIPENSSGGIPIKYYCAIGIIAALCVVLIMRRRR